MLRTNHSDITNENATYHTYLEASEEIQRECGGGGGGGALISRVLALMVITNDHLIVSFSALFKQV